jgi:hypothetical protein
MAKKTGQKPKATNVKVRDLKPAKDTKGGVGAVVQKHIGGIKY